jgi:hypothetical protein
MKRFVKKIRNVHELRGYYSYLLETLIDIIRASKIYADEEILIYFDLTNIPHYMQENLFDVCFTQNKQDYIDNFDLYVNLETVDKIFDFDTYNTNIFPQDIREITPKIFEQHFILKEEFVDEINRRLSLINPSKTIGVHRRDTDMKRTHHVSAPNLNNFFEIIDEGDYEHVFLMSDNQNDINLFREKYGEKLICYEDGVTSHNSTDPFFLLNTKTPESTKKHIEEITINTIILSKLKKLICTKSNLSSFAIMINPELEYVKLN